MTIARPLRPTDVAALAAGGLHVNEALTWDRLGRVPGSGRLLGPAVEQWASLSTRRHVWVSIQGATIAGALSARPRGGRLAWEIDRLSIAPAADAAAVAPALLEATAASAIEAGVTRVFLRVESARAAELAVRRAGFTPYVTEWLMRLDGPLRGDPAPPAAALRHRSRVDGFPLFRLYNAVTPVGVRQQEAATYAEWIAAQERRGRGRGRLDDVAVEDGEASAWVRAASDGASGRIDLLSRPGVGAFTSTLIGDAVRSLGDRRPVSVLVPSYAGGLAAVLEEHGFAHAGEYTGFVRRLAIPICLYEPVRAHHSLVTA